MKMWLSLTMLLLSASVLCGQEIETVFQKSATVGGFGAPIIKFTGAAGDYKTLGGAGGAVVINDFFAGIFGIGDRVGKMQWENRPYNVNYGYGGLWLGYAHQSWRAVHPYTSLQLGWGAVDLSATEEPFNEENTDDNIFVAEPELGVEVNLFKWFKLAGTVGYRFTTGAERFDGFKNSDLSAFSGSLTLRFGGFGKRKPKDAD
jgi:hypothetical protein